MVMAGLGLFNQKSERALAQRQRQRGLFLFASFLRERALPALYFTQKYKATAKGTRRGLKNTRSYALHAKKFFGPLSMAPMAPPPAPI
jgi:hypothetical protein